VRISSIGKNGDKDKSYSSSKRLEKSGNDEDFTSDSYSTNGFETNDQTPPDSDSSSSTAPESESQSESKSTQANEKTNKPDKAQLELTKTEIYNAVRQA